MEIQIALPLVPHRVCRLAKEARVYAPLFVNFFWMMLRPQLEALAWHMHAQEAA